MAILVPFKPSATDNFQFNLTLDGASYIAVCTWYAYGERYYIAIYDTFKTLIVFRPVIGSPDGYDIDLLFGYFQTSKLVYRVSSQNFEVLP